MRGDDHLPGGHVPDFALTRGNGVPLYTLVNPVDDALMEITHVLRGEDLLPSTPRQIALYQALIAHRRRRPRPGLRPPAARARGGQQEALQARPAVQPVPAPRPRLHPRGPAELPGAAGLGDRRRPRRVHPRRVGRGVRHRRREPQPGPLRPEEGRRDQRRPHPDAVRARLRRAAARTTSPRTGTTPVSTPPVSPRRPAWCRPASWCWATRGTC